jgi:hypothetical protein
MSKHTKGRNTGRSSLHQTQDRGSSKHQHRLVIVLRSLALIDDSFSKVNSFVGSELHLHLTC